MSNQFKLKTKMKESQALPFIKKIGNLDGLRVCLEKDFQLAWKKFQLLLLICEQNKLQYWVNLDFRKACFIYDRLLDFRTTCEMYNIMDYQN